MSYFPPQDRILIAALRLDPNAEPAFEAIKGCLVWPDEVPKGVSRDGYEKLSDVLAARGMLHQGRTLDALPSIFRSAWKDAIVEIESWPGFNRVNLSAKDRQYLSNQLTELEESEEGL